MSNFGPIRVLFWLFSGPKKSFPELLRSFFGVVPKSFEDCFWTQKRHFWLYFRLERVIYDLQKIEIVGQILVFLEGHFDDFLDQKSRYLDFLIFGLEFFRRCLGIVFGLKRPLFASIFGSIGWYMTYKIKILCQILASKIGKMTLSEDQNWTYNFDFGAHISAFRAENTPKRWPFNFKAENNAQTSEQL